MVMMVVVVMVGVHFEWGLCSLFKVIILAVA